MKVNPSFKIVHIADEVLAIPIGKEAESFKGVVLLTEESAFLLENIDGKKSVKEIVALFLDEYDVEEKKVTEDISRMLQEFVRIGLIEE